MHLYLVEQSERLVPADNAWLGSHEALVLHRMRFPRRRSDWRLGRWTAKQALASCLHLPTLPQFLAKIEILADTSGAPSAFLVNNPLALSLSLSHRAGTAICTVAPSTVKLGCDMELIEPHTPAFITDYFTAEEQELIGHTAISEQPRIVTLLWSAKESALKAMHEGLRLDTRTLTVTSFTGECDLYGWSPLQVRHVDGQVFDGWWQSNNWVLRTVLADPSPESPHVLQSGADLREQEWSEFAPLSPAVNGSSGTLPVLPPRCPA